MEDWTTRPLWANRKKMARAKAAIKKLGYQVEDTPEANLMFAVLKQAIMDAFKSVKRITAKSTAKDREAVANKLSGVRYLESDMVHAQLVGLDPEYVRSILIRANLMPNK